MPEVVNKIESYEKSYRVEVTKNSKGYTWSIKASGEDTEAVKAKVLELEAWCRENYASKE